MAEGSLATGADAVATVRVVMAVCLLVMGTYTVEEAAAAVVSSAQISGMMFSRVDGEESCIVGVYGVPV